MHQQHPRRSTPHQFHFWTARESAIGIGAIVRVEERGRTVFGVVTDGVAYSDLVTPMHAVIGADGDPVAAVEEPSQRAEIRLFTAAVLRQIPEEPLQPVPLGSVWLASDADVVLALRMDAYTTGARATGIPVGLYAAGGLESPVFLDCDFLLGPEAAHLNITGVSGLATKTSAVEFLLSSIFQTFPAHKGSVAAVCFNVKGPDLCFLDQPGLLADDDLHLYEKLGLRAEPFRDVRYYAPFKPDGVNLNTLRTHEALAANTQPLVWGLREVLDYAEVVLNRDDVDAKADAFIDFLAERVVGKEYRDESLRGRPFMVQSFADLDEFFRAIFDFMEAMGKGGEVWKTHHVATIRKVRNRLSNISTRSKGLVTDDGAASDLALGRLCRPERPRGRRGRPRPAGPGSGLCPRGLPPAGISRAPRAWRRPHRGLRGRAQQVRAGRRPRYLRSQDAARSVGARTVSGARPLLARSNSGRRCSAESSATRGRRSTAAWTSMSWPRRDTRPCRLRRRSSLPRSPRAS